MTEERSNTLQSFAPGDGVSAAVSDFNGPNISQMSRRTEESDHSLQSFAPGDGVSAAVFFNRQLSPVTVPHFSKSFAPGDWVSATVSSLSGHKRS